MATINKSFTIIPGDPLFPVCLRYVFNCCVPHRLSPEDWPLPGQGQTVSLLGPILLPVLSPWRHHHYTLTDGAQLGSVTTGGGWKHVQARGLDLVMVMDQFSSFVVEQELKRRS